MGVPMGRKLFIFARMRGYIFLVGGWFVKRCVCIQTFPNGSLDRYNGLDGVSRE